LQEIKIAVSLANGIRGRAKSMSYAIDTYAVGRAGRTAAALGLAAALIALPLGLAGTAAAGADPGQFQLAQGAGGPQRPSGKPPEAAPAQGTEIDSQIADLQKKMRITAAQQPLFDAFAQVMRQNAQALDAVMRQQEQKSGTTAVDDLRASAQLAEAEAEGLKRLLPAFQSLYDSLPDPQKRLADAAMRQPAPDNEAPAPRPKK
jgi:periplasmic protein CpxP/Spy